MDDSNSISFYDEYPYHILRFKTKGRQPKDGRNIDIAPTRYIKRDASSKQMKVKYPGPPYSTDRCAIYNSLLEDFPHNPPSDWNEYNCEIIGKSSKFIFLR